ncbi:retrotransposon protein [Cucumis melo var. makuwa]|uniref:Retrotransposon protein n=1 Tax=Cucumis melo var. makuwa TaxID=1194695 RepID=A0A5A7SZ59_CUCMM|nr:retrotransposon protein [Cucumis melo var. makuwa]
MSTSNRAPRHDWTKEEEDTLVECLMELVSMVGWKSDNGTFRPGYLAQLRTFQVIAKMSGPKCSGFGWNDEEKCIIAEKELLFDNWVRSHLAAKGLLNKPFPYYSELTYVFDRDRVRGRFVETFADMGSNEPGGTMYVHPDLLALQRVGPDRVDPRGGGEVSETWMLKAYIWRSTKQTNNSG